MSRLAQHLREGADLLARVLQDQALLAQVDKAGDILVDCLKAGGKVLSAGNGGSHCDAMHFAEELSGRYRDNRPALGALAISDPSHITCVGNDYGFEFIFSRQVEALGRAGDVFLGISTSGNSGNILAAAKAAKERGMKVIISTDAHHPDHFQLMRYGVITARRGWLEKKDVLNTLPSAKLLAALRPLPK